MTSTARVTYRGWPGHYTMSNRCIFRLNTLVELGNRRIVVSTVGNLRPHALPHQVWDGNGDIEPTHGLKGEKGASYYETMVFNAKQDETGEYWDADHTSEIRLPGHWTVDHYGVTSDNDANRMHEKAVQAVIVLLRAEEKR